MQEDFESVVYRVESNDGSLVELDINSGTPRFPFDRTVLVQRAVAALANNTHVKSIKIYGLNLTETEIAPLAKLLKTRDFERVELGGSRLTGEILFPALAVRKSLRVLDLSYNEGLTALEHLSALNTLRELDLRLCGLSAVPPAVLQLPNLEGLTLGRNPLKTLPASFASLIHLNQLDLGGCGFSEFPAVLLRLTQLEKLDISWNSQITSVPDGITALVRLKSFVSNDCGLKEFPLVITRLAILEELNLSSNSSIKRVPDEIANLQSLKLCRLSRCGLTTVPAALWTLAHLETLTLSSNPLMSLPGGIGALRELKKCDLSSCSFTRLPSEMQQLSSLEFLDIKYTKITHLPVWLASLWSLKELRCSSCPFAGVAVNEVRVVTFDELAALVGNSRDPEEVKKQRRLLERLIERDPMRLLRTANMHLAPRTLRVLCVIRCAAHYSRLDLGRLPAHIRDEIALVAKKQ